MAQVLKEEIKDNILSAALNEFYCKNYSSATMRDIAKSAGIPTGLIYTYYKNKYELFKAVIQPVTYDWYAVLTTSDEKHKHAPNGLSDAERKCLLNLLNHRKEFIIMINKSHGTEYENQKEEIVAITEKHLNDHITGSEYDPILIHIVANSFVEGLMQIMYHYKTKEWAVKMLDQITKMYFSGIGL